PQVASIRSRRSVSCKRRRLRCRRHRGRRSRTAVASTSDPGEGVDVSDLVRPGILKRLARSPACHFVVVGILLFLADGVWRRLVADDVAKDDESLYREALRLQLDRTDVVVRRHLVQLVSLLLKRAGAIGPIREADLRRLLERDADRYRRAETITFTQVYLDPA